MKKLKYFVLAVAVLFGAVFCLSACSGNGVSKADERALLSEIGGCSETYVGAISEERFDVASDAVEAFVHDEVAAEDKYPSISETKLEGSLSESEIASVGITDEMMIGAKKVEKYTVTYTEESLGRAISPADGSRKTRLVYIIDYGEWFQYFSPVVVTGDTVTKSYFDSIFRSTGFENCTLIQSVKVSVKAGLLIFSQTSEMTITSTIRYADNRIYLEEKIVSGIEGIKSSETSLYIEIDDDRYVKSCYMLSGGSWQAAYLTNDNILVPFGQQYLHYSYFTKTDFGCTLGEENMSKYMEQALDNVPNNVSLDSVDTTGCVNYYVSDGMLSGLLGNIVVKMTYEGVDVTETITSNVKCINRGTTEVTSPIR